jgi:Peptide-N-glycosidase F, C terminal
MRSTIFGLILIIAGQLSAATPEQSYRQIIPAVAHTEGVAGSFWRTSLVIFNPSDREAFVSLNVFPSGFEAGGIIHGIELSLEPMQTRTMWDLRGLIPGFTDGTGYLEIEARDIDGQPVPIVVDSRTWTGEQGSYGQGIPAVAWSQDGVLAEQERRVLDLESSDDYRTNLGIVNLTGSLEQSFLVKILDAGGAEVGSVYHRLGPHAHIQRNDILRELGLEGSGYTAVVRRTRAETMGGGTAPEPPDFVVYGSKVDQRSNDPTYLASRTETTQSGLPKHRLVPAAARIDGADGSSWQTDVTIHSAGDAGITAMVVELIPTGGDGIGSGSPERYVTTIGGGQTKALNDIIGSRFDDHEVAALVVQGLVGGGGNPDLRVSSRTWTPTGSGDATMGQGIPGIPRRSVADPVVIPGFEESNEFRTNLGLVNPSQNMRETLNITFYDAAGAVSGETDVILEPWSHIQLDSVLGDIGLQGPGFSALVTMTGAENLMLRPSESWEPVFMAYGSRIDRMTNDPTFIEGVRLTPGTPEGQGDWVDFNTDEPWFRCPDEPVPDEATVVRAFDQDLHWFGSENHRSITREVDFPEAEEWNQVGLRLKLECPENGLCDHWDRTGSLQLVLNPEDLQEEWRYLEIMRHITPYRVGMCQYVDITALAPMLTGRQTLVSWIDTWVGPGHTDGEGWRITWDFVFYPGDDRTPDEVVNIWGRRSIVVGNLDPDHNVDSQIEPVDVVIPADASRVEARLITTGHSFGNSENCAEFCVMRQDLYLDGNRRSVLPWRTDCEYNPVNNQQGTWLYDRNGWCPGAITIGQIVDVTDMVTPGETAVLDFDIRLQHGSEYENTNPGGGATPIEWVSLQIYIYRD